MDKISELLREAKPLYLKRKRRRNQMKIAFTAVVAAFMFLVVMPQNISLRDGGQWLDYEQYISAGSSIEDMGLPVDEYGLLMVS
ncbi:MAG: hypothetical protein J6Y53_03660 [Alphaproteobacteria bacterium]|nr:hypothetical protein [Alphaproteobacteria bacterium]